MTQNMNRRNPGRDSHTAAPHSAGLLAGLSGRAVSSPLAASHVSPISRRRGSIAAGVSAAAALTAGAIAAPEGAQIVVGNVTFTQQGNNWVITASNGAIIDYVSFDILPFETVRFLQPDTMSTVLNRINSAAPTRIDGTLLANGQVYFINPAGVTFGAGSFVDCAAIYAAAANLSNEDFLAGRNNFTDATGSVINEGTLHGGTIAMIGRHVANYGSISTPVGGTVVMAAGSDVLVGEQGGHLFARVSGDGSGMNGNAGLAGVENHGTISAPSGRALMAAGDMFGMAIFNTGTVRARDVNIDGGQHGVVQISGKIDASSSTAGTTGGSVRIVGEKVGIVGANIDARGAAGGGSVTIGRDLTSASDAFGAVFIGNDSTINADATVSGNGGDVRIYGRDVARVGGNISARGAGAGYGGSVVMAGSQMVLAANVNTSGGAGGNGRWTIDVRPIQSSLYGPRVSDITITTSADDADIGVAPNFDVTSNANTVNIQNTSIVNQLNLNQVVTIQNVNSTGVGPNGGRISLLADLSGITGSGTLDIQSVGEIDIQGNIGAGAGALNLVLNSGGGITIGNGFALNLGAGTFNSTNAAGNFTLGLGSSIVGTGAGASSITATAGNININGDINLGGAFTATANAGFASLNGDLRSGGLFSVSAQAIIVSGGIIGNGITLSATDDIGIDVSPGLSLDAGAGALQILAGSDGTGTLSIGSAGFGDMTFSGSSVLLSAGTLLDINSVALNVVGNTTLRSSDFSITSTLAGNGANTLTFRGFGGGAKTFRISNAGGSGDIDILSGDLANLAGFTSQTFGQAGDTINLAADLTLTRATIFAGGTTLLSNVTLSGTANDITFAQTVDGAFDLVVNTTGVTTFGGIVGGGAALNSLSTNAGGTTILTGNVTTVGAQDYNDNVVLAANVVAASTGNANITFGGTIDADSAGNNRTLTINTTGVTTFTGNVGATQTLGALSTNAGGSTLVGGTINTTGLLSFGDALSFNGAGVKTLTAGDFAFGSTVTGVAGQSLSLQSAGGGIIRISAAGGTGDTDILSGAFNNINGFDLITLGAGGGTIRIAGPIVVFQDNVDFAGNVVLFANSILSSAAGDQIKFSGTVNADAVGNNRTLSINTVGATIFGSTVGDTQALASLTTNLGGTTTLFGNVTTTGAQTYNDAVELAGNVIAASINNQNITFGSTVNAAASATDPTLTVNTTGTTAFGGVVGGTKALGALTTNAGGTTTLAGNVTTTGAQTYNDAVRIGADLTLNSTDATLGGIVFGGNVDASGAGFDLIAQVAAGRAVAFSAGATGGGGGQDLNSITTTGGNTSLSGTISTVGLQSYSGATTLTGVTNAISTGNAAISFLGTVDSSPADSFSLSVSTSGLTTFGGNVGGIGRLDSLTVDSGGNTEFAGDVTVLNTLDLSDIITFNGAGIKTLTAGEFSFGGAVNGVAGQSLVLRGSGAGANTFRISAAGGTADIDILTSSLGAIDGFDLVTLGAAGDTINLDDAAISASTDLLFAGAVVLLQNAAITSTNNDNITFGTTVDGTFDLIVNTTGSTVFTGVVGGNAALNSLQTNIGGTTSIGGDITTVNAITFGDDVILTGNAILASTGNQNIVFNGLLNGTTANTESLTINTGGQTQFNGAVGGVASLASLTTDAAGSTRIGANITTGGAQTFNDTVTLNAASVLTSTGGGNITFAQTVDGAFDLTVNTTGNTVFTGLVGNGAALTSLTTDAGGTTSIGANVTTTGAQAFNDAVTLAANVIAASTGAGNVTFGSTVNGAFNLTVNTTGVTTFGGAVSVASLTTDAGGSTNLGAAVTTSAAQTYNDAVVLTGNVTATSNGSGAITFANSINGAFDLVLNTGGVTTLNAVGQGTALRSLTTGAGGSTIAKGSITVTDHISILEAALVENAITFSGQTIFFGGTLDSNAGFADLTLNASGTASFNVIPIRFGGDIGMNAALGSLTIGALSSNPGFATIVFSDQFAQTGGMEYSIAGITANRIFTVKTNGGNINFGALHRTLAFGTLNLDAGAGTATFGDLTALGDINVTAGQIQIRLREGGQLFSNSGSAGSDIGTDLVAFGNINFSTAATFIGSGSGATYTTGSGNTGTNLTGVTFRAFDGVLSADLFKNVGVRSGTELLAVDVKSDGPTDTDLSTLLAGAIPRLTGEGNLAPNARISDQLKKDLKDIIPIPLVDIDIDELVEYLLGRALYNDMPESSNASLDRTSDYRITSSRLSGEFAQEVVDSWRMLMRGKDESGNYTINREEEIKDILGHAWQTYIDDLKEEERPNANAEDFLLYLEKPNLESAREIVEQAREFFAKLDQMGLTPFEAAAAKKFSVLGRIKPAEMPFRVLRDTISPPAADQQSPQAAGAADQAVAMK